MLKTIVFLLGEKNRADKELKGIVERTIGYFRRCGFKSLLADSPGEIESSFDKENKITTLIICDDGEETARLVDKGYYAVGFRHDLNKDEEFTKAKYVFGDIEDIDMDSFVKAYQRYSGEPWEILRTDRLLVRETTIDDVDEFYKLYADPSITEFMEGLFENPEDEKRYQSDYIQKVYGLMGFGVWTLERLTDGRVIGRAGYSVRGGFDEPELGFLVGKEYQRQGYAMEACRAILEYGKTLLCFEKVQTLVKAENAVSIHMCEALGFEKVGEVDIEENIYGKEYHDGQKVAMSQAKYGKYVRMTLKF